MSTLALPDEFDECSLMTTDVTFVDETLAETFDCSICFEKFTNAVAVCEDHLFCEECVNRIESQDASYFKCPVCRRKCNRHDVRRVKFIDRQIKNLMIKCPNHEITPLKSIYLRNCNQKNTKKREDNGARSRLRKKERSPSPRSRSRSRSRSASVLRDDEHDDNKNEVRNDIEICTNNEAVIEFCEWTGKLNELAAHISQCPFEIVRCAQCRECIERGRKEIHNEECSMYRIECKECKQNVPRQHMKEHINKECMWSIIGCGNCNKKVMRKEINEHYNQCPEAVISCDFYRFGCEAMSLKRKNLSKHLDENIKNHLHLVCQNTQRLEKKNNELQNKVKSMDDKLEEITHQIENRFHHLEQMYQYNFSY